MRGTALRNSGAISVVVCNGFVKQNSVLDSKRYMGSMRIYGYWVMKGLDCNKSFFDIDLWKPYS